MNRLSAETSPYLQQHAGNPVDWFPWGAEALERARAEDKPILLSIGYSACHWCHVMAHESFEDPEIAGLMNRLFINVKVDREERPDLDHIYQAAHALLTRRSGGWPLTMFLTPSQQPFFGGTYFPPRSGRGRPGMDELLPRVAEAYRAEGPAIAEEASRLTAALALTNPGQPAGDAALDAGLAGRAYDAMVRTFDLEDGGFGGAPKFPHPTELEFCLRRHALDGRQDALAHVKLTLARMQEGGIQDQLAGGFCRYSVDESWTIPHFEKMLYDNAALLRLYADGSRAARDPSFARTAEAIVCWLMNEMHSSEAGFYSSLDADSEGEEGRFYVWTPDEARAALSEAEAAVALPHWGLDGPPNFEHRAWHLRVSEPLPELAVRLGIAPADAATALESARSKLLYRRSRRVRPGRDEKVLTSWNALTIAALARAARVLGREDWLVDSYRATDFVRRQLWRGDRLLATRKDGRSHLNGYLDDHAFMLAALLELMQSGFRKHDLAWAIEIADTLLARFEDPQGGGFHFTSHDHEPLILRAKPGHDSATPSGNGVAARALISLGHWLGETRYIEAGERTVRAFATAMTRSSAGFCSLIVALEACLAPPFIVLLRGDQAQCSAWQRELEQQYRPGVEVLNLAGHADLPGALVQPAGVDPRYAAAWLCREGVCLPPLTSRTDLEQQLALQPQQPSETFA